MIRKRLSNDNSPMSKRAKNGEAKRQAMAYYDDIDSIPLRSTPKTESSNPASVSRSFGTQKNLSKFPPPVGITTSFSASTASPNTSFSASGYNSPLDDSGSEYFTSQEWSSESENEVADAYIPPKTLGTRLRGVWPRFANETFNEAPLAVTWEITRIALHCGVNLADCNVLYDDLSQWNDQYKLRNALLQLPAFKTKMMPQLSCHDAWNLALKEFQSTTKAVTLSAELLLNDSSTGPLFSLKLSPLQLETSHRLSRRFGADRFLELLMPSPSHLQKVAKTKNDNVSIDAIVGWLTGKHYFLGRRWTAFYCRSAAKKKTLRKCTQAVPRVRVFLFASEGNTFRRYPDDCLPPITEAITPDRRRTLQVHKMIDWAIGGLGVADQPVLKLFSRISLSLSHTYPTVVLEKHQIHNLDYDIGSHETMNDGIGRISKALATKIALSLGLNELPSAFQARFGSAKGMWIIDSDPSLGDGDWIVTYPSQRKWDCDNEDKHHRTFEVKEWSKEPRPASLNQQFIPVLEAQAIDRLKMRSIISAHLRSGLLEDLAAQKTAMEDPAELRLWLQQCGGPKSGGVDNSVAYLGGLPRDSEQAIAVLLDSGFDPKCCQYLQELCWDTAERRADVLRAKMNILVPCSAYLYMVVDFSSALEEDEVHVSFSTKFQVDGFCDTLLEGMDVLVARAPSHLPSDIQRVKVVSKPQLRQLKDVIVFSTKGRSPLADKLSGGDYDGDRAWVCWDQDIVKNFRNATMPGDDTDPVKRGILRKSTLSMAEVRRKETSDESVCTRFLHESFIFNMQPFLVGICTNYKDRYSHYTHVNEITNSDSRNNIIILSRMLGCLVDQPKQGYIFTDSDWDQFREKFHMPKFLEDPDYMKDRASQDISKQNNSHILDFLKHVVAATTIHGALQTFSDTLKSYKANQYDEHLTKLFNSFDTQYKSMPTWTKVRQTLKNDINSVSTLWKNRGFKRTPDIDYVAIVASLHEQWRQIEPLAAEKSSDLVQHLLQPYMADRQSTLWELLKASYAFKLLHKKNPRFVWRMAGRQLAMLKPMMSHSATTTSCVLVIPELYSALKPDKKLISARRAKREAATAGRYNLRAGDMEALDFGHDNADMD